MTWESAEDEFMFKECNLDDRDRKCKDFPRCKFCNIWTAKK
jgi:hypothetical protein